MSPNKNTKKKKKKKEVEMETKIFWGAVYTCTYREELAYYRREVDKLQPLD
jgi:hypothetical protein